MWILGVDLGKIGQNLLVVNETSLTPLRPFWLDKFAWLFLKSTKNCRSWIRSCLNSQIRVGKIHVLILAWDNVDAFWPLGPQLWLTTIRDSCIYIYIHMNLFITNRIQISIIFLQEKSDYLGLSVCPKIYTIPQNLIVDHHVLYRHATFGAIPNFQSHPQIQLPLDTMLFLGKYHEHFIYKWINHDKSWYKPI